MMACDTIDVLAALATSSSPGAIQGADSHFLK